MDRKSIVLAALFGAALHTSNVYAEHEGSFLIHQSSGKCLTPLNRPHDPNRRSQLGFMPCEGLEEQEFRWLDNGNIQHVITGRCVKPEGPLNDVTPLDRIKLVPRCGGARFNFKHTRKGAIRHIDSSLCVHPEQGGDLPPDGSRALLKKACGKTKAFFTFGEVVELDEDNDGVANSIDQCPGTPAGVEVDANGCPIPVDTDGDGILDGDDACPFTPEPFAGGVGPDGCFPIEELEDQDGDGVFNVDDQCPDTPRDEEANAAGCSVSQLPDDSDNDGVPDDIDLCPNTPESEEVDATGCPIPELDSDGDGFPDSIDACPFTPEPFVLDVGPDGCFFIPELEDQDGDGIFNGQDQCPDTPRHEEADNDGCSISQRPEDSDGDGVPDEFDECPFTEPGTPVDPSGCPTNLDSDADGLPDELEINIFGTDPFNPDTDFGGVFDGEEVQRGTDPLNPLDDQGSGGGLPAFLTDGNGFLWDIGELGEFMDGTNDAFDGGFILRINGNEFFPVNVDVNAGANEVIMASERTLPGLTVQRRISVSPDFGYARIVDSFTNNSAQHMTLEVSLNSDLGSDGSTVIMFDSSGDGFFDESDSFLVTDDFEFGGGFGGFSTSSTSSTSSSSSSFGFPLPSSSSSFSSQTSSVPSSFSTSSATSSFSSTSSLPPMTNGDPAVTQVFAWFDNNVVEPIINAGLEGDNTHASYRLVVRPGETISLMSLGMQGNDPEQMLETLDFLITDFELLFEGLNPLEIISIGNFVQPVDSDGDGLLDDHENALGTNPSVADSDGDGRLDRESVLVDFDPNLQNDTDGDGVIDFIDQCIFSSREPVDEDGCPVAGEIVTIIGTTPATPNDFFPPGAGIAAFDVFFRNLQTSAPIPEGSRLTLDRSAGNFDIISQNSDDHILVAAFLEPGQTEVQIPVAIQFPSTLLSNTALVTGTVEVVEPTAGSPVIINDAESIAASSITLGRVFDQLASEGTAGSGAELFRQFWDAQRSVSAIGSDINCLPINGFDLSCDRAESDVASMSEDEVANEMLRYNTLAFVNRIELRSGWQDCGEHRIIFGRNDFQRNFLIVEARVPNPTPGDIRGCEAVIRLWEAMPELEPEARGADFRRFFMDGLEGHEPVISVANLAEGQGQIRTNQFITPEWVLREYDLAIDCNEECRTVALPVRVNENPFGELFNPDAALGTDEFAEKAAAFQAEFAGDLSPLLKEDIVMLSNPVSDEFNHGQSHSSGPLFFENFFIQHFGNNLNSPFGLQLQAQLQGQVDALGNPLTVEQILNRATAMTCAGCHEPAAFGLTVPNSIGAFRLSDGTIIDRWPNTLGFVHVDEQRNLSPALRNVFIPAREEAFASVLEELDFAQFTGLAPTDVEVGPRINER